MAVITVPIGDLCLGNNLLPKYCGRWKEQSLGKRPGAEDARVGWGAGWAGRPSRKGMGFEVTQAWCECQFPAAGRTDLWRWVKGHSIRKGAGGRGLKAGGQGDWSNAQG